MQRYTPMIGDDLLSANPEPYACMGKNPSGYYILYSDAHALEERVAVLEAALTEIVGCFDAAFFEGLAEQMGNDTVDEGSVTDLVRRRLLPAGDEARKALEGEK